MTDNPTLKLRGSVLLLKKEQELYENFSKSVEIDPQEAVQMKLNFDLIHSIVNYISLETGADKQTVKDQTAKFLGKKCNSQLNPQETKQVSVIIDALYANKLVKTRTWYRWAKKGLYSVAAVAYRAILG